MITEEGVKGCKGWRGGAGLRYYVLGMTHASVISLQELTVLEQDRTCQQRNMTQRRTHRVALFPVELLAIGGFWRGHNHCLHWHTYQEPTKLQWIVLNLWPIRRYWSNSADDTTQQSSKTNKDKHVGKAALGTEWTSNRDERESWEGKGVIVIKMYRTVGKQIQ